MEQGAGDFYRVVGWLQARFECEVPAEFVLSLAGGKPGAKVDAMEIMTATATMDPVRPEAARIIAAAFTSLGWDVKANPIDYNQNVQKVIMEHDYDMWLVMLSGASLRIISSAWSTREK